MIMVMIDDDYKPVVHKHRAFSTRQSLILDLPQSTRSRIGIYAVLEPHSIPSALTLTLTLTLIASESTLTLGLTLDRSTLTLTWNPTPVSQFLALI